MNSPLKLPPKTLPNYSTAVRPDRTSLLITFWLGVIALIFAAIYTVETKAIDSIVGAVLIAITSLLPLYLWCSGRALGLPIFPLFALTYLWTHAIPLVANHPVVITYSPADHLLASLTVSGFLVLGTFTWFQFVKSPPPPPKLYRAFRGRDSEVFFLIILGAGFFFNMYSLGGWFALDGGSFSLVRGAILGLNVLAVFILSYRCGSQQCSKDTSNLFWFLFVLYLISSAASLILIAAASTFLISTIAFTIGRRKLPLVPIAIVLVCLSLLHFGKGEMRAKYFSAYQIHFVQPWEYPAWYAEWVGYSFDYFNNQKYLLESQEKESFFERSSVIQMLLLAQYKAPNSLPYLSGATYAIIPELLVPRIFNNNKIRSHEGTYILSIHYGLQTREATFQTTIGWGLLAEAYANFGYVGCGGLAIILGTAYGMATRWSINTPLLSDRSFFAVLMMSLAFQTEWTAGYYVATLFQSAVTLALVIFLLMKVYNFEEQNALDGKLENGHF